MLKVKLLWLQKSTLIIPLNECLTAVYISITAVSIVRFHRSRLAIIVGLFVMMITLTAVLLFYTCLSLIMQNKSVRHYDWFIVKISINLHIPGYSETIESSCEFISAFSLRQLECCVRPYSCFPRKFANVSLRFELLGREIPSDFNPYFHPRCCRNYESIKEMILRNVIYVLAVETCLNHSLI